MELKNSVKQSDAKRAEYVLGIEVIDPEMLVFIHKTGCDNVIEFANMGMVSGLTPVTHHRHRNGGQGGSNPSTLKRWG